MHSGFKQHYDDAECLIEEALNNEHVKGKPLFITGHSLGGAVASIATKRLNADRTIAACYTFGSPRVGNEVWVSQIKSPIYRIVNSADFVPTMPFHKTLVSIGIKVIRAAGFRDFGDLIEQALAGYAHAGNMRFLTNCPKGDYATAKILYTVGWGRRFWGAFVSLVWTKILKDHKIEVYRKKMFVIAEKRNP